jgi:hypothetical protein
MNRCQAGDKPSFPTDRPERRTNVKWLLGLWYARLRKIDMQILWPSCVEQAGNLARAKAAFSAHAFHDPAWMFLGEAAVYKFIDELTEQV